MAIKIEHGCITAGKNKFLYAVTTGGYVNNVATGGERVVHIFTVEEGQKPEIGDFIEGGKLVKREGYQVNNDSSRWRKTPPDEWGRGSP